MASLDRLLDPRTIAVAGVSADERKHGARVVANLLQLGYDGVVWGVNPSLPDVAQIEVFASMTDLPTPPDLVVAAVPAPAAIDVVARSTGAGGVVVFASGFGESGRAELEESLRNSAATAGVRVIGPNSGGLIRPGRGLGASFLTCLDRPHDQIRSGPLAVVTQSGGIGSYLNNLAFGRGEGIAVTVSTGNEADVELGEAIEAVSRIDEVSVVLVVLETVRDGEGFFAAIRSCRSRDKAVVACRLGSGAGAGRLLASHTGAVALPEKVLDGVFATLGIPVAATPEEAYEVASVIAASSGPPGPRAGIVTHSGGFAILLSDLAERAGVSLPQPTAVLAGAISSSLDHGAPTNPLDMGAIIGGPERFARVVGEFAASGEYDLVLAVTTAHPPAHTSTRARSLLELKTQVPLVHLWMAGDQGEEGLRVLRAGHAAVTDEPRAAVAAVAALTTSHGDWPVPNAITGPPETWGLPALAGMSATTAEESVAVGRSLGYPVVVKAEAVGLLHKTEIGAVRLDVRDDDEVRDAFDYVMRRAAEAGCQPVSARVQPYRPGVEIVVGGLVHETLGPLVSVGMGGVLAEITGDVRFAPGAIDVSTARRLVDRLSARSLLDGYRGAPPADVGRLAEIVSLVSRGIAGATVTEFEINPLVWDGEEWLATDQLVVPVDRS